MSPWIEQGGGGMTGPKRLAGEHTAATLQTWRRVRQLKTGQDKLVLDGDSLDMAGVVAVARHGVAATISDSDEVAGRVEASVRALEECLGRGWVVYGVNTGFGGSADSRTSALEELQLQLLQHTQSGIIGGHDAAASGEQEAPQVLPAAWVRGAMAVRANQNLRGHSAVRLAVLQRLLELVRLGLTPLVPLRGSISASGDLMPMAYIAGAVTGNPDVLVQTGSGRHLRVESAPQALARARLPPQGLRAKEALGLINGTAPSAAAASLVLHDAHRLALVAQLLTAMAAEGLAANVEWALPFVHHVRPHAGQLEAAANMRRFLRGSRLVCGLDAGRRRLGHGLWQDRYSTRTAPQWIGPYLDDLLLAHRQLHVELNSTSDNPIVDAPAADVYSGGNFQATALTSAMDKTRLALQMLGRILFSQVSEMISPSTNNGLDANLHPAPLDGFAMKGIDVNMAAYMSELAALAHPVSAHVMSAEMHNQGINSLALLTARRTAEAADLVAHMAACHIYVSCQALDLRVTHQRFLDALRHRLSQDDALYRHVGLAPAQADRLLAVLLPVIETTWYHWNAGTWLDRIPHLADAITAPTTHFLASEQSDCSLVQLAAFRRHFESLVSHLAAANFPPASTIAPADVAARLGNGTARLYAYTRAALRVPCLIGIQDDPLYCATNNLPTENKKTIGSWVTIIYESLRRGPLIDVVLEGIDSSAEAPRTPEAWETLCKDIA
ncbi:hypothetical protein CDD81_1313 [Ophiocordyceps australis]|uniref:Phenylalanine ammonia-lyase n=1 Tax=Ophiocordyceps australis TaxID=1399860 RepID=A0A2C5Y1H6_9HYPO|nr:hypothetical protein CDD81_1313 [Ophiocordyceps australis]